MRNKSENIFLITKIVCRVDSCEEVEIEYKVEATPADTSNVPSTSKSVPLIVGRESLPTKANRKRKVNMSEKATPLLR